MTPHRITLTALLVAATFAVGAHAQTIRTRAQVEAELADAIRTGNMLAPGESGLTLRELNPGQYPAAPAAVGGVTPAQVAAELAEARRTGSMLASGESGLALNETNPQAYPAPALALGKTRAQVQAELREAIRTGNIIASGESGQLVKDLYPGHYANIVPASAPVMSATPAGVQVR